MAVTCRREGSSLLSPTSQWPWLAGVWLEVKCVTLVTGAEEIQPAWMDSGFNLPLK